MTSRLKDMRIDIGVGYVAVRCIAGAVVGRICESLTLAYLLKDPHDGCLATAGVATEPLGVSGRGIRDGLKVKTLGYISGVKKCVPLFVVAAVKEGPLLVDAPGGSDLEIPRELEFGNTLNNGIVHVLGGAIGVDVSEEV